MPSRPNEWIQIDLVVLISPRNKSLCQYLLTSICTLTNYFQMQPLRRKTGPDIIRGLGRIFCSGGVPRIIQSDNGKEFKNTVVQDHARWLSIEWRFSTPYKPSTQGRVERKHQELGKLLRILELDYENIEEEIPYIQLELNASPDRVTQLSPFECFHGWAPNIPHVLKDFPLGSHQMNPYELEGDLQKLSWEENLRISQSRALLFVLCQLSFETLHNKTVGAEENQGTWIILPNSISSAGMSRAIYHQHKWRTF